MGKRSDLTVPQRREVVLMLLRREEPAGKLARRFGISEQTLHRRYPSTGAGNRLGGSQAFWAVERPGRQTSWSTRFETEQAVCSGPPFAVS